MKNTVTDSADSPEPVLPRSHRLVRRLALLYGICVLAVAAVLGAALLPARILPQTRAISLEAINGGLAAMVLAALALALTGLLAALALTAARYRNAQAEAASSDGARKLRPQQDPGFAARQGQAFIVPLGAVLIWVVVRLLWPTDAAASDTTTPNIAAAFVFALAFMSLVAERVMNSFPEPQLPEAPALRRLLLLTTISLAAAAAIELGRGAALTWLRWPEIVLAVVPGLVATELAIRALARLFLPPPAAADARAATDSILASVITGGPRAPGTLLRTHLGLDFARSWALQFLSAAIPSALLATALLCWALTGLKLIELGQRGVYERFGAPVRVLGPGLHLLLPWPLGRLRPVEFGTIHSVAIGVDQTEPGAEALTDAEAAPPPSLNRLWESAHPGQAQYLLPSRGTGSQGFQTVSTEISVLYRVGLTDAAAMQSVYTVADPESLIRESGSRRVLRYFNSRELDSVLGARRENVAGSLRDALAADLDAEHAGVEIVSVLIEEIHPPAGAAAAYHAVQAAQINASASISDEVGRAKRTAGIAQQEAHQLIAAADAKASETLHAADADSYRFGADRRAYGEGAQAFLLERSFNRLRSALVQTPLTIVDHRLSPAQGPILDLRESRPAQTSRQGGGATPDSVVLPAGAPRSAPSGAAQRSFTPEVDDSN